MKTNGNIIKIIVLLLFAYSCEEKFMPDVSAYQNLLVVEGKLINHDKPQIIKLSYSSSLNNAGYIPCTGCNVYVSASNGEIKSYAETGPGIYQTDSTVWVPQINVEYTLNIITSDGEEYRSEPQKIRQPAGIDSVYAEIEYQEDSDLYYGLVGYRFFVSTAEANTDTACFMWELTETWEFTSDFTLDYFYQGQIIPSGSFDSVYRCWKTNKIPELFVYSTEGLTQPLVHDFPLHYVTTETRRLMIRYSLLVDKYVISEDAHAYWNKITEQLNNQTSLFFSQPYSIQGNIRNINDDDERVLGYFYGAGKSSKRIFVDRPYGELFYYEECIPITDLRGLGLSSPADWPIYITLMPDGNLAYAGNVCFDCTLRGGQLDKPDFWIP